ncbi:hypothetical protein J6590_014379 [Homalodisca vitripennis]|nr:hypothetical protein J6590_014379 [Homalodisca vitripennis]
MNECALIISYFLRSTDPRERQVGHLRVIRSRLRVTYRADPQNRYTTEPYEHHCHNSRMAGPQRETPSTSNGTATKREDNTVNRLSGGRIALPRWRGDCPYPTLAMIDLDFETPTAPLRPRELRHADTTSIDARATPPRSLARPQWTDHPQHLAVPHARIS